MKHKCIAIVLSAGKGKRMQTSTPKQYLLIRGVPLLYYPLKVFEESFIDEIVIVASKEDIPFCQTEIVDRYGFKKIIHIIEGGKERYHSVYRGIQAAGACDYLFIHDGARPFVTVEILKRAYDCAVRNAACVVSMPVKDTIKIADENGFAAATPRRDLVWMMQTPQVFAAKLIIDAYDALIKNEAEMQKNGIFITDDAMVVETFTDQKIKLTEGSYKNIKITTPEDLLLAEAILADSYGD